MCVESYMPRLPVKSGILLSLSQNLLQLESGIRSSTNPLVKRVSAEHSSTLLYTHLHHHSTLSFFFPGLLLPLHPFSFCFLLPFQRRSW